MDKAMNMKLIGCYSFKIIFLKPYHNTVLKESERESCLLIATLSHRITGVV